MAGVVVLGSVNIDLTLRCAQLPRPGETVMGQDFRTVPGGKGANQAVAAARLGAQVSMIGCVGGDDFGRSALAALQGAGVDTAHVHQLDKTTTGVAMIMVDAAAENCIALASGANALLSREHVDAAASLIAGTSLLVCQLETPLSTVMHAIELARAHGVPVLLNPAPAPVRPAAWLTQVDVLVPNETEAATLVGLAPQSAFDPAAVANTLCRLGARNVIVTLGEGGVQFADGNVNVHLPAPKVRALDTTGAGDTFIGAFAAARSAGDSMMDAIASAQRAAAYSVTRAGAMESMPSRDELEAWTQATGNA